MYSGKQLRNTPGSAIQKTRQWRISYVSQSAHYGRSNRRNDRTVHMAGIFSGHKADTQSHSHSSLGPDMQDICTFPEVKIVLLEQHLLRIPRVSTPYDTSIYYYYYYYYLLSL